VRRPRRHRRFHRRGGAAAGDHAFHQPFELVQARFKTADAVFGAGHAISLCVFCSASLSVLLHQQIELVSAEWESTSRERYSLNIGNKSSLARVFLVHALESRTHHYQINKRTVRKRMNTMNAFVQVISDQEVAVKGCGRACADMQPTTLPVIPVLPPLSLLALMRAHPDMEFQREWLEAMDAGETIH
jgi:hypothetical protein